MSDILIVDDEPLLLRTLRRLVSRAKHTAHCAAGYTGAMDAAANQSFSIALVDYSLRGPDGLQVLEMLREQQPGCVRILMSGRLEVPVIIQALNDGIVHQVLAKPLTSQSIYAAIDSCQTLHNRLQNDLHHFQESALTRSRALIKHFLSNGHLQLALQPIISADQRYVVAHEALMRSSMPELKGPMEVISTAEQCGMLLDVSAVVAQRAAEWMPRLPAQTSLFINLHPEELNAPERMLQNLTPLREWSHRIVLEITEHSQINQSWIGTINCLRDQGFSIAVDDLGSGYNSLMTLATLQPDYIKVDMSITRDINADDYKQRLMSLLVQLADGTGSTLLAEGVETDEEADTLVKLGVHLLQGYRFGRPSLRPAFMPAQASLSA